MDPVENIRSTIEIGKNLYDLTGPWCAYHNNLDTNMETLKRKTEQLSGRNNDINVEVNYAEQRSRKRRRVEVKLWQENVRRITDDVQTLERQELEVRGLKNPLKRAMLGKRVVETIEEVGKLYENGEFSNGLLIDDPTCGHAIPTVESLAKTTGVRNKKKIRNFFMDDAGLMELQSDQGEVLQGEELQSDQREELQSDQREENAIVGDNIPNKCHQGMDPVENIRSTIEIGKNLCDLTGPWCAYHNNLDTNMETLKRKTEQLSGRNNDINEEVNDAEQRSRKRRRVEVKLWQENVRRITDDVQTLERRELEVRGLKNALRRATFGKRVVETIEEVGKLYKNGEFSNGLLIDDPTCGHAIPTVQSLAKTTGVRNKEKIWNFLMDDAGLMELQSDQGEELQSDQREELQSEELQSDQGEENAIVGDIIPNKCHQGLMELQSDQGEENALVYDIIPNKHHQGAKLLREEESDVFATKVPMQKPQYEATLCISDLLGKDESIIATGRRGGLSVDLDRLNNERKIVGLRLGVGLLMTLFSRKEFITKMTDKLPHSLGKESSKSILPAGKELEDAPLLFFCDVSALHVLDLSYTSINSLPQSISRLNALQKLILRGCDFLMELPPEIGELTNLEVIDLEGTEIIYLPKEIAKLIKLSCLKVSFYRYANNYQESKHIDTIIPSASLSTLSRLNELSIDVNPGGDWWDVEVRTIIHDLCSLRELRTLKLYLPTIELLKELIRDSPSLICPALTHFRFIVGRQVERFLSRLPREVEEEFNNLVKSEKGLKYVNGEGIPIEIIDVLKHANAFFLEHHWTVNNLSEFGLQNMDKLKFCFLVECNELRTIIDANQFYQGDDSNESEQYSYFNEEVVLGSLQYLSIRYMKNMESICQGSVGKGCLSNLKFLALHTCLSLTTIFTVGMLRNLVNLEELIVEDCTKISSLVDLKNSDLKSGHFLPSLKKILLLELPKLVSISNGLYIAPKLERMVIFYCPKLVRLSTMEVSSKDLKVIKGENEWWGALKWHESDLSSDHQDYLASVFVPLRRDGDLMAQFTKD